MTENLSPSEMDPDVARERMLDDRIDADALSGYDRAMAVGKRVLAEALAADLAGAIDQARATVVAGNGGLGRVPRVCWYCNNPVPPGDGMYCPDHTEES